MAGYTINMEHVGWIATVALHKLDKTFVGDPENYLGLASFWHYDYRHYLRDASIAQRKRVHRKWAKAGLDFGEVTYYHLETIHEVLRISHHGDLRPRERRFQHDA